MKRKLITVLSVILIFNLIMPNFMVIAYPETIDDSIDMETGSEVINSLDPDIMNHLADDGEAVQNPASGEAGSGSYSVTSQMTKLVLDAKAGAGAAGVLAGVINTFPAIVNVVLSFIVNSGQTDADEVKEFTIQDTVLGEFDLFDINFFNVGDSENGEVNNALKESVAVWYNVTRNMAMVIALCVLIYTGMRMAVSTVVADKVKYKQRLVNWIIGFAFIFLMHYIILFSINIANAVLDILPEQEENMEVTIMQGKEDEDGIRKKLISQKGWNLVFTCILYWMIVYYQVKFFYIYVKRFLLTGFLIILTPIIGVYYGMGHTKSYKIWMKELLVNIAIQPLHAIIYLVFITSAAEIAEIAPLLAILFFSSLSRGEKIVKNIFRMRDLTSINSLGTYKIKNEKKK